MEDDDDLREGLRQALVEHGHAVSAAASGAAGMRVLETLIPDIVVTDIVMEDGEGISAIVELHKIRPELPVIAISGNAMYLEHSLKLGARQALLKPFKIGALMASVEDCLNPRRNACA